MKSNLNSIFAVFVASVALWTPNISFGLSTNIGAKVYVANEADGTISVIDVDTNKIVSTIDTMRTAKDGMEMFMTHNVQASPDGKAIWVTAPPMDHAGAHSKRDDEVVIIDPLTDKIIRTINLGKNLHVAHVTFDSASQFAFVTASKANKIFKISASTYEVLNSYKLRKGRGPHGARWCADILFVAEMDGKALAMINTNTGKVSEVSLGGKAVQTACTPDGKYAFASLFDSREVIRIEVKSKALLRLSMPKGSQGPVQIYLSPDNSKLYVADQGVLMGRPASDKLVVFNVKSGATEGVISVGKGPHGVVVDSKGIHAFVTNVAEDTVSIVDLKNQKTTNTVKVGKKPNGISVWTSTEQASSP